MIIKLHNLEKYLSILFVALLTGALTPLIRSYYISDSSLIDGDPIMQIQWILIYVLTFLFIVRIGVKNIVSLLMEEKWILFILVFISISFIWADFTYTSLRRIVALIGTSLFGIYLARRFPLKESLIIILKGLGVSLVASIFVGLTLPDVGLMKGIHEGALQGIFLHKNIIGRFAVLFSLIGIACLSGRYINKNNYYSIFIISILIIVWSRSFTALSIFILLNLIYYISLIKRKVTTNKVIVGYLFIIIFFPIMLFVMLNTTEILDYFGRDITLTGRTVYWGGMILMFLQRPILGHGYGSFWVGHKGSSGELYKMIPWEPMHAHNGYIDLLLGGGIILLILFLVSLIINYSRLKNNIKRSQIYYLGILYLIFFIIYNFSESLIAIHNNLFWVVYVYITLIIYLNKN